MPAWNAKDPYSVFDYRYNVALDEGDTLAQIEIEKLSGSVNLDSQITDMTGITVWLSGGTDGETAVFRVFWTTDGGRQDDDVITLPVVANELAALMGYDVPGPGHLIARYPAFASVPTGTIATWIADARRIVTDAWDQEDYAPGILSLAAHLMALQGLGTSGQVGGVSLAGLTSFKSGTFSLSRSEAAASESLRDGYGSTVYGREFAAMLRRNVGGIHLVGCHPVVPF